MARESFDASDPFDSMAESIRRATVDVILSHMKIALFRDLPPAQQLQAFVAGTMTAVLGCSFVYVTPDGRDAVEEMVTGFVRDARLNAEAIADDAEAA